LRFDPGGFAWRIVGIDDAVTGHHDVDRAWAEHAGEPTLVLSHLAELASVADRRGAAMVLSGHTHGGQIPNGGVVERVMRRMGHRYILGWYMVGETPVYVNRGIGAAVFPWRTQPASAEVAGIELGPAGTSDGPTLLGEGIEEIRSVTAWPGPPGSVSDENT
jgi:predicted MPP superfamily phosphohydrolase